MKNRTSRKRKKRAKQKLIKSTYAWLGLSKKNRQGVSVQVKFRYSKKDN